MRWGFVVSAQPLLCLFSVGSLISAAVISSSNLEYCANLDGDGLQCEEKIVVTIGIDGGQDEAESLEFQVSKVTSDDGLVKTLESPIVLTFRKTVPKIRYPLQLIQRVNNRPQEVVLYRDLLFSSCQDSGTSSSPTCGWAINSQGAKISDSQGFCCECSLGDIIFGSDEVSRAALSCDIFGSTSASAHCLRFDTLWYSAMSIGSAVVDFDISIMVAMNSDTGMEKTQTLQLSPEKLVATSSDADVAVRLLGDFSPFQQYPTFDSKYLFVPAEPKTHERVLDGVESYMVVDKSLVDLTGNTCNKVGVSYSAFRYEVDKCKRQVGSCLKEQLADFYLEDIEKQMQQKTGTFLINNYGKFEEAPADNEAAELTMLMQNVQLSVLTISITADDVRFVINVSPGVIERVSTNATIISQSFWGSITAEVLNTGGISADYYLRVENCTNDGEGLQIVDGEQTSTIQPAKSTEFQFRVTSTTTAANNYKCLVQLRNARLEIIDSKLVNLTIAKTDTDSGSQGGESPSIMGNIPPSTSPGDVDSCSDCDFWDIPCMMYECWGNILMYIALALLLLFLVYLFISCILPSCLSRICKGCLYCVCCKCVKSNSRKSKDKHKKEVYESGSSPLRFSETCSHCQGASNTPRMQQGQPHGHNPQLPFFTPTPKSATGAGGWWLPAPVWSPSLPLASNSSAVLDSHTQLEAKEAQAPGTLSPQELSEAKRAQYRVYNEASKAELIVFFNMTMPDGESGKFPRNVGKTFSIAGRLTAESETTFRFHIPKHLRTQTFEYHGDTETHVPCTRREPSTRRGKPQHGLEIPKQYQNTTGLDISLLQEFVTFSPRFRCVNLQ